MFVVMRSLIGVYLHRFIEVYPSIFGDAASLPFGLWEVGTTLASWASGACATRPSWSVRGHAGAQDDLAVCR